MAKQSITLNARLKWPDVSDDYIFWQDDLSIGRMRLAPDRVKEATPWEWSVIIPMDMPPWAHGVAATRDDCMREFSAAWGRILKVTPPARLARALELQRAAEGRQPKADGPPAAAN